MKNTLRSSIGLILSFWMMPLMVSATTLGGDSIQAGPVSFGGRAMLFEPKGGDGSWSGGGQLRIHLSQAFAIEGSADYRRNDYGSTSIHTWPVQASLLFNLIPNSPLSVFLLGGAGWYYTTIEEPNQPDDTDNRFGPHAGGGVQLFLNKLWSVDATYRYIWLEEIHSNNVLTSDYEDSGHMITAALNYHFGGGQ